MSPSSKSAETLRSLADTLENGLPPDIEATLRALADQIAASRQAAPATDDEMTDTAVVSAAAPAQPIFTVSKLRFSYKSTNGDETEPVLRSMDFEVFPGQRVLLVGVNGAGKSTLLRTVCGYHIAKWDKFEVDGVDSGDHVPWSDQFRGLAYLGGVWARTQGFVGVQPYSQDIAAGEMLKDWQDQHRARRDVLVDVLGINLDWRMHRVSDGQRKKVRIMLKLLRPFKLCVIDEFAVELDIFARKRFMDYLARECDERGAAVIYATHIFDQADDWSTHLAMVQADRTLSPVYALSTYEPYQALVRAKVQCPMYRLVLNWMLAQKPGELDGGDTKELEATPAARFVYSDSGYESGRSGMRRRTDGDEKKYLAQA